MAENRFKKSIENATDNTRENIMENITEKQVDNIMDNIRENAVENTTENILEKVLQSGRKDKGGNHTIYLSADVGNALIKYAKKSKKSKSELVDDILREVFKI